MKLLSRIKNLWNLSEYHPGQPNEEYKEEGSKVAMIVKPPEKKKDVFVPRFAKDPVKAITEEQV